MNKLLHLAHWLLVSVAAISLLIAARAGLSLWQTNKVNDFISNPSNYEQIPEHAKAQFAQAYSEAQQDQISQALERLTEVVTTKDTNLQAAAYFNRGNIHLRKAQMLMSDGKNELSSLELAKQDYRTALLINSSLWDVRFNLELALLMAPEKPAEGQAAETIKGVRRAVRTVGFRVDLP